MLLSTLSRSVTFVEYEKAGHGVYRVHREPLLAEGIHSDLKCRNVQEEFLPILMDVLFFLKKFAGLKNKL
jgi:hypothetical protein